MKKIMVVLIMILLLLILTSCSTTIPPDDDRITTARIRYLDGSMDVVEIEKYKPYEQSGSLVLRTADGRTMVVGANNVIIINESKDQYECKDE